MNLYELQGKLDKNDEKKLDWFLSFAEDFLEFSQYGEKNIPKIQAVIVSQNEPKYNFIQYKDDGKHCVTRPINSELFLTASTFYKAKEDFVKALPCIKDIKDNPELRDNINKMVYTCQQSIGCVLDGLNNSNKAKIKCAP